MQETELIPHLFRTEYRKIVSVLCKAFGIAYIETAEDIVSDTFLLASETWGLKGLPKNPTAWLYTVSKNKAIDFLKRNTVFNQKIVPEMKRSGAQTPETDIDLSGKNITDSQLQMMFAICHPAITADAQVGLSLNILCGFGAEEIADAFLSNKETIYKRLARAKEKLKTEQISIELPSPDEIAQRTETVLKTIYLLFNEGYYSSSQNTKLRKDLCLEAMRLNLMLTDNEETNLPQANALLALMCFHASRFEARTSQNGDLVLYEEQDESLWNTELILKGETYLNKASTGNTISKYHLEAAIAYWHTHKKDSTEKWESILQLYNKLLLLEYSPLAALNRTYALSKANSKQEAIMEAEKLDLTHYYLYHSLLGELYKDTDPQKAITHLQTALKLVKTDKEKTIIANHIHRINTLGEHS
jgi:RNA polymerase sigma-70 factor (ECF subfamily)